MNIQPNENHMQTGQRMEVFFPSAIYLVALPFAFASEGLIWDY